MQDELKEKAKSYFQKLAEEKSKVALRVRKRLSELLEECRSLDQKIEVEKSFLVLLEQIAFDSSLDVIFKEECMDMMRSRIFMLENFLKHTLSHDELPKRPTELEGWLQIKSFGLRGLRGRGGTC